MDREIFVYVDTAHKPAPVGRLWTRSRKGQESASFEYDRRWLANPDAFPLEPSMTLGPGPHHTLSGRALFGALGDSAPDRWGRVLMRRSERRAVERDKRTPRTLTETDFLLMVDDETRMGALRFAETECGPFHETTAATRIPPFLELPKLLSAAERFGAEKDTAEDIRLLLAPGSSLGGARPKASVRDRDGTLAIAKFPQKTDEFSAVAWESVALTLAAKAGIDTPRWRVEPVAKKQVLLLTRFDRGESARRIPFLSAMSMLGASDREPRSYMEIADAIRRYGAEPLADLAQLWRRIVFNILISNTDDHLRNHAFLFAGTQGWRLSPAYDMNPVPPEIKPRVLSTFIDLEDGSASLDLALGVAGYFKLPLLQARAVAADVARATTRWRTAAAKAGIKAAEIDRMAPAFEHRDLTNARKRALTA